ncbi:hypothetical protein ULMA_03570 [Patiriisocius marinus]|uniref:Uncharacterized protein n=1 Tax=Patiriisocius marinus TaxID=1397112 RepID=A0A5J4IM60_9FLAO|nr:hypothetical protein [Patiriisocius marinus]GER58249.1 hypothetical protein ULMA_03570 [Patiriisocius marinus]
MTPEIQKKIAESFFHKYAETELNIELNENEFGLFQKGVFAASMDEKWNIFIEDSSIFFVRSWTDNCIFKVGFEKNNGKTILNNLKVTRDKLQYKSTDIEYDTNMFKKVLEIYLKRKDLYPDKRINLPLIQRTIEKHKIDYESKNHISSQSIELILKMYDALIMSSSKLINVIGIEELRKNTAEFKAEYELLSLHLSEKENPRNSITFFFNQNGTELIGKIIIERRKASG